MNELIEGSKENLIFAVKGLAEAKITNYVVIGGWCPYLNRQDKFHPGTIDVDILFSEGSKPYYLREFIMKMNDYDYFTSAKHQFQLLKVFDIGGQRFCFNIDLLHTSTEEQNDDLFVDQLDLNVIMSQEEQNRIKMKSIVQKESSVIFDEKLYTIHTLEDGTVVNVVDFTGMFITKLISCQKDKRDRDSYDIYLGFITDQIDVKKVKEISRKYKSVELSLESFVSFLKKEENRATFNKRVKKFMPEVKSSPSYFILEQLGIEKKGN